MAWNLNVLFFFLSGLICLNESPNTIVYILGLSPTWWHNVDLNPTDSWL